MRYTHPLTAKNYGSQQKNFQAAFVTTFGAEIAAESIVNSVTDSTAVEKYALTNRGGFLPLRPNAALGKTLVVVAFDWCQWTGKKTDLFLSKKQDRYKINQNACPFLRDIEVSLNGTWQKVATLWTELGAGIDKTWCMVKLENKFCYQDSRAIVDLVISLNSELGIHFKNYNRLDVCGDFQSTDYRNFTPQMFIDKCAKEAYTFKGKKYQDKGQDGKKIKDFLDAECDVRRGTRGVETIRVGQRKSGLSITMYNKTKEMKVKGEKPWVKEQWREACFFDDMDTFRIEFQYMKSASVLASVEKSSGEIVDMIEHEDINVLNKLDTIFKALYTRNFVVSIFDKKVRFSRRKRVELLKIENVHYIKTRLSEKMKNNNMIKAEIRRSVAYAAEYKEDGDKTFFKIHASETYRHIKNLVERHDLAVWFKQNFPDIDFDKCVIAEGDLTTVENVWQYRFEGSTLFKN